MKKTFFIGVICGDLVDSNFTYRRKKDQPESDGGRGLVQLPAGAHRLHHPEDGGRH